MQDTNSAPVTLTQRCDQLKAEYWRYKSFGAHWSALQTLITLHEIEDGY
jgi:hypothetical protein